MGLSIELSCDALMSQGCYTQYGDFPEPHPPVVEVEDRPFAITKRLKEMRKAAREDGWVKSRQDGWFCPPCRKMRDTGKDEEE